MLPPINISDVLGPRKFSPREVYRSIGVTIVRRANWSGVNGVRLVLHPRRNRSAVRIGLSGAAFVKTSLNLVGKKVLGPVSPGVDPV